MGTRQLSHSWLTPVGKEPLRNVMSEEWAWRVAGGWIDQSVADNRRRLEID